MYGLVNEPPIYFCLLLETHETSIEWKRKTYLFDGLLALVSGLIHFIFWSMLLACTNRVVYVRTCPVFLTTGRTTISATIIGVTIQGAAILGTIVGPTVRGTTTFMTISAADSMPTGSVRYHATSKKELAGAETRGKLN